MGKLFVGKVLMSLYEQPAKAVTNGELQPIEPGAWAAWAKTYANEQATKAAEPVEAPKASSWTPKLAIRGHLG